MLHCTKTGQITASNFRRYFFILSIVLIKLIFSKLTHIVLKHMYKDYCFGDFNAHFGEICPSECREMQSCMVSFSSIVWDAFSAAQSSGFEVQYFHSTVVHAFLFTATLCLI